MAQDQTMLQGEDSHQNHKIVHPRRKMVNSDADDEYEFDDEEYSEEFLRHLDKAESNAIAKPLSNAASDEDEDLDSQNKAETPCISCNTGNEPVAQSHNANDEPEVWFTKLKYMQDWLYWYFAMVIHLLIHNKNGSKILLAPPTFTESKPYVPPTL
ncbi:hypothetical protein ARMGADRAFT_1078865 [Armillaria gallica]|uniref:Uncharacterized protein n=1 Tax=Armillaria gallica TaxID=47427 RepID=A0A2H3E5Q9_ARMGA|nr:hypothetical protein ARMGADRAFT_1078865 [Armillaria gallica]